MKLNNVRIKDNGSAFLITSNDLIVSHHKTLGDAWRHIEWMYKVAQQKFTVGKNKVQVSNWLENMYNNGYLD